jgi:hypothetical protein
MFEHRHHVANGPEFHDPSLAQVERLIADALDQIDRVGRHNDNAGLSNCSGKLRGGFTYETRIAHADCLVEQHDFVGRHE